jgi:hypothetical protein
LAGRGARIVYKIEKFPTPVKKIKPLQFNYLPENCRVDLNSEIDFLRGDFQNSFGSMIVCPDGEVVWSNPGHYPLDVFGEALRGAGGTYGSGLGGGAWRVLFSRSTFFS